MSSTCQGIIAGATEIVTLTLGLASPQRALFVAEEAKGVKFPTALRWLSGAGPFRMGVALVDGRIVTAVDARTSFVSQSRGLLIGTQERGDALLLVGVEIVAIGSFPLLTDTGELPWSKDVAGPGRRAILHEGGIVPIAQTARIFDELERVTWESRRASRAPISSEERRSE